MGKPFLRNAVTSIIIATSRSIIRSMESLPQSSIPSSRRKSTRVNVLNCLHHQLLNNHPRFTSATQKQPHLPHLIRVLLSSTQQHSSRPSATIKIALRFLNAILRKASPIYVPISTARQFSHFRKAFQFNLSYSLANCNHLYARSQSYNLLVSHWKLERQFMQVQVETSYYSSVSVSGVSIEHGWPQNQSLVRFVTSEGGHQ